MSRSRRSSDHRTSSAASNSGRRYDSRSSAHRSGRQRGRRDERRSGGFLTGLLVIFCLGFFALVGWYFFGNTIKEKFGTATAARSGAAAAGTEAGTDAATGARADADAGADTASGFALPSDLFDNAQTFTEDLKAKLIEPLISEIINRGSSVLPENIVGGNGGNGEDGSNAQQTVQNAAAEMSEEDRQTITDIISRNVDVNSAATLYSYVQNNDTEGLLAYAAEHLNEDDYNTLYGIYEKYSGGQ